MPEVTGRPYRRGRPPGRIPDMSLTRQPGRADTSASSETSHPSVLPARRLRRRKSRRTQRTTRKLKLFVLFLVLAVLAVLAAAFSGAQAPSLLYDTERPVLKTCLLRSRSQGTTLLRTDVK